MARSRSGEAAHRPRGAARVGVLLFILLVSLGTYIAVSAGGVYLECRKFRDQMTVHGQQAQSMNDETMERELAQRASTLGLPPEATTNIEIRRSSSAREIQIESRYERVIRLPFLVWTLEMHPHVSVSF